MLSAGAHETLKKLTEKGGDGQPDISVGEKYARKSKQRMEGEGGQGVATELVARIFGVPRRTANRAIQECAGGKRGRRKYGSP